MNFSEINSDTKTLPAPLTTGTGGGSAIYESKHDAYDMKGGRKKSKKSRKTKKSKKSKKTKKSGKSKKRECKEINIYM